eukprot:TRINITY_DN967_c0_g1_i1.p1 TRINITY_DN967_c0_g1~~TRINITY_DN967_c0_g1_i1.p1  ORF type:complete len:195 (-),score=26.39 TRINITY_DN967_c0_g1_i1:199-783(-)
MPTSSIMKSYISSFFPPEEAPRQTWRGRRCSSLGWKYLASGAEAQLMRSFSLSSLVRSGLVIVCLSQPVQGTRLLVAPPNMTLKLCVANPLPMMMESFLISASPRTLPIFMWSSADRLDLREICTKGMSASGNLKAFQSCCCTAGTYITSRGTKTPWSQSLLGSRTAGMPEEVNLEWSFLARSTSHLAGYWNPP